VPQANAIDPEATWSDWLKKNVKRRYRKTAMAAITQVGPGASSEQAAQAALTAAAEANLAYMARSALVAGGLALLIAVSIGGLSILFFVGALVSGIRGRQSARRGLEAWIGIALAAASLIVFAARVALG
jgi:hypothetical protein